MSFGFSPSDVLALVNLTSKAYRGWKHACGEYADITGSLDSLLIILERIEAEARKLDSVLTRTADDRQDLEDVLSNCEPTVRELHAIIDKYKSLASSRERNWDRLRFGVKNLSDLRAKLTQHIAAITAYLDTVGLDSLGRIERGLNAIPERIQQTVDTLAAEIRAGRREGSIMTTNDDDEKDVWRLFRRELIGDGMRSSVIHRFKPHIRKYLRELAEKGELEECAPEGWIESEQDDTHVTSSTKKGNSGERLASMEEVSENQTVSENEGVGQEEPLNNSSNTLFATQIAENEITEHEIAENEIVENAIAENTVAKNAASPDMRHTMNTEKALQTVELAESLATSYIKSAFAPSSIKRETLQAYVEDEDDRSDGSADIACARNDTGADSQETEHCASGGLAKADRSEDDLSTDELCEEDAQGTSEAGDRTDTTERKPLEQLQYDTRDLPEHDSPANVYSNAGNDSG